MSTLRTDPAIPIGTIGRNDVQNAVTAQRTRIPALDFTKGALVLFMVLYHWQTSFHALQGDVLKYLRFLTPSFIFITGFLISNVYFVRYKGTSFELAKRLVVRGLKILGIFVLLNLCIGLIIPANGRIVFEVWSLKSATAVYLTGNDLIPGVGKAAAFQVLVPIGYLLLVSAGLQLMARRWKYTFQVACAVLFLGILALDLNGLKNSNLELLAIGLMGVVIGYVRMDIINRITQRSYAIVLAYAGYVVAITVWNVLYPLQIIGVCLTLMLLYLVGVRSQRGRVASHVILLGKYSLFGYIIQIAIIQLIHGGLRRFDLGPGILTLSLFAAVGLTIISVEALDYARATAVPVDRLYRTLFA